MRTEDYLRELLAILFAQKKVIVWTTICVFAGAVAVAFFWPPMFSATSGILVKSKQPEKSPEVLDTNVPRRFIEITKADLASEIELLTSPAVIQGTVTSLRSSHPGVLPPSSGDASHDPAVYTILKHLKTEVVPLSNVVSVTYLDRNPGAAVDTLNALLSTYLSRRGAIYNVGQTTGNFFEKQSRSFKDRLEKNDEKIVKELDDSGSADPEKEIQNNLNLKLAAQGDLNRIRIAYLEAQATHRRLKEAVASADIQYFSYLDSFVIVELAKKLTELYADRSKALKTYHPESDIVKAYDEQVAHTAKALKAEASEYMKNVGERLTAMETQIGNLERTIAGYDQANLALRKQLLTMNRLNAESQLLRFSYETYNKRAEEESVDGSLGEAGITTRVTVLSSAFPSNGPVFPRPAVVLPLGALVGLILGVSLALLREYFDHTFKKPSDVATNLGLPVLASLSCPVDRTEGLRWQRKAAWVAGGLVVLTLVLYGFWIYRFSP